MRRVVITGPRHGQPARERRRDLLRRACLRGENGRRADHALRRQRPHRAVRAPACELGSRGSTSRCPTCASSTPSRCGRWSRRDEALRDAGLDAGRRARGGAASATAPSSAPASAGSPASRSSTWCCSEKGPRRVSPHFIPRIMANAVSGQVAIQHGLLGTCFTTSSACASSGHAIGMALRSIQSGEADLVITGGSESATTPLGAGRLRSAKALSTRNDDPEARLAALRQGPRRLRDGRGRRDPDLRGARARQAARRARSTPRSRATARPTTRYHITAPKEDGGGPARALRAGPRRRHRPRARRLHQRARHEHALQRRHRDARHQAAPSATTRASCASRRPSR